MGISTDGMIGFGVECEEGTAFPWDEDEWEGDVEDWWRSAGGYEPLYGEPFADGGYAPGWSSGDPRLSEHFDHQRQWEADNPMPVRVDNYCSDGYPMYALVVPSSYRICHRGYPTQFSPGDLVVTKAETDALAAFVEEHSIETSGEPGWMLMSYYG